MAKDQRNVEAITPMEVDFAKWYTDICLKAELVDYASVKGFMILRPYGYAIWENIQRIMDGMFKKTGHVNVAMPVLIPESLLKKEGELVEGFAPEVAWVTMGGSEKLEERLAFRPTSETMFCDHWHNVLQSYRELPMLYNQWCSVIRWEKTTRPFLRSREFCGRRAIPSMRRRRRPSPRPSSSSTAMPTSAGMPWPCPWSRAAKPTRKSSPAPRPPIPSRP